MWCTILKNFRNNKHSEKPKIKHLKIIDLFSELPFYEELNVIKTTSCVQRICNELKSRISRKKDPIEQVEASKLSITDLFIGF